MPNLGIDVHKLPNQLIKRVSISVDRELRLMGAELQLCATQVVPGAKSVSPLALVRGRLRGPISSAV